MGNTDKWAALGGKWGEDKVLMGPRSGDAVGIRHVDLESRKEDWLELSIWWLSAPGDR